MRLPWLPPGVVLTLVKTFLKVHRIHSYAGYAGPGFYARA